VEEKGVSSIIVIAIVIVIVIATWGVACSSSENTSKTYLVLTTDRKVYSSGDTMKVTIKNISENVLWFGGSNYDLFLERWDGTTWQFFEGVAQLQVITALGPDEIGHVTWKLENDELILGGNLILGRYRVGAAGTLTYLPEIEGTPPAYAEFEVVERPGSRWPLIAGIVVAIAVIGIAVAVYVRRR
jgi:hypothetical protein